MNLTQPGVKQAVAEVQAGESIAPSEFAGLLRLARVGILRGMANPERQQNVLDLLNGLRRVEPLKQLFRSELNYQRVNERLSRWGAFRNEDVCFESVLTTLEAS